MDTGWASAAVSRVPDENTEQAAAALLAEDQDDLTCMPVLALRDKHQLRIEQSPRAGGAGVPTTSNASAVDGASTTADSPMNALVAETEPVVTDPSVPTLLACCCSAPAPTFQTPASSASRTPPRA